MKKKIPYILPFCITILCFILFNLIGSTVSSTGVLQEPFFLIPIGYLFFFLGLLMLLVKFITYLFKNLLHYKKQ